MNANTDKPRHTPDCEGDLICAHSMASFMAVASLALLSGKGVDDPTAMLTPDVAWGSFYIMSHIAELLKGAIGDDALGVQS